MKRREIEETLTTWYEAWNRHDLDGVMELFHPEVVFENWTGATVEGRQRLRDAWKPWFENHGGFVFNEELTLIDETSQRALFAWTLDWPSQIKGHGGKRELRRGADLLHFKDGKIIRKDTYSKTYLTIGGERIRLRP